ncbi:MAG TPA: helix-turn-helix domain-containing protein [Nitrososphaeraceae archaeon]|jgi:DNA-binding HxlR family transcriptional regulator|nr:helix-turn-helix domain-containing protein [Nitrososphaeraceae archaeon]
MMMLDAYLKKYGMRSCPIDNSLKIIGKKFTMHILRNMILLKQNRFNQFLESIEGINTKTLSVRLREMEEEGLINRAVISNRPVQTEYSITEKGKTLEPVLELLAQFSMKYEPKIIFKDGKLKDFEDVFDNKR